MLKMKNIIQSCLLTALTLAAAACNKGNDNPAPKPANIKVNTLAVGNTRATATVQDNTFKVLFWRKSQPLETPDPTESFWLAPYLVAHAPQPVSFYQFSVFDTTYPYPTTSTSSTEDFAKIYIYATGYAPGEILQPDMHTFSTNMTTGTGYAKLTAEIGDEQSKARFDFMGCDAWNKVYRGSQADPFSQEKNKLYFRHLAAKLTFYADRDRATMENEQFVRDVQVKNLQMSIDSGKTWTSMYTPSAFEWKVLEDDDFTASYNAVIEKVRNLSGNADAIGTRPAAGYQATEAETFAGLNSSFVLKHENKADRVPIRGMAIDSCYVCNPIVDGEVQKNSPIQLKMDISAEMSYNFNFPLPDDKGTTTDNMTFTRQWENVVLQNIYTVDATGNVTTVPIYEFKPGYEYRIYIHFNRTGVNLVAKEMDWDYEGVHFITITGGDY